LVRNTMETLLFLSLVMVLMMGLITGDDEDLTPCVHYTECPSFLKKVRQLRERRDYTEGHRILAELLITVCNRNDLTVFCPGTIQLLSDDIDRVGTEIITGYKNGYKVERGTQGSCCFTVSVGFEYDFKCEISMSGTTSANFVETMDKFTKKFKREHQIDYKKELNSYGASGSADFWGTWFGISASGYYSHTDETINLYERGEMGLNETRESAVSALAAQTETTLKGEITGKAKGIVNDADPVCLAIKLSQIEIRDEYETRTLQVLDGDETLVDPATGATDTVEASNVTLNLLE